MIVVMFPEKKIADELVMSLAKFKFVLVGK